MPEAAEGGGDGVAVAGDGQVAELGRVEVGGELGEAGRGRMLDALVDREDGEVAGAGQAAGVVDGAEVAQDGGRPVGVHEDLVEVVGAGKAEVLGRERLGHVVEQRVRLVAEQLFDGHGPRA